MHARNHRLSRLAGLLAPVLFLTCLAACGGGAGDAGPGAGNGGAAGGGGVGNGTLFGGVQACSDGSRGALVPNVLQVGDRFEFVTDRAEAERIAGQVWDVLRAQPRWFQPSDPLNTWRFYEDPSFLPGPLFRWTGFDVQVGQIVLNSAGLYHAADGRGPFLAVGLRTWDYQPEFLVIESARIFHHAIVHTNGLPIVSGYAPGD